MGPTSTRREARERALQLAYEAEVREVSASDLIESQPVAPDRHAVDIVLGAKEHAEEIDALLARFSQRWSVERMPAVDRALLRLATYELGWRDDVPTAVILDEAVELARQYSTADSPRFVNGLLSAVAAELRPVEP